jgi:hypothetical protein
MLGERRRPLPYLSPLAGRGESEWFFVPSSHNDREKGRRAGRVRSS